jgi:hypothetical protein
MFDNGRERTSMLTAAAPGMVDAIALGVSVPAGGANRARPFDSISPRDPGPRSGHLTEARSAAVALQMRSCPRSGELVPSRTLFGSAAMVNARIPRGPEEPSIRYVTN